MLRMSVISANFIQPENIDKLTDLNEAKQMIQQMQQEKEQLELDLKQAKDKAITQILGKEQQIIDLMTYMDEQTDQSKQEISRLQQELQSVQKIDRQKDGMGN